MKYGNIKYLAVEDGVGCRTVLFVSGCRHRCKGCFQQQTWDFDYGEEFTEKTEEDIMDSMTCGYVSGITLLGGEPFEPENQAVLVGLLERFSKRFPRKSVWAYTGCTWEELMDENSPYHTEHTMKMLELIDILVDGPFIESQKNMMLPFRGSENQRVIDVKASLESKRPILSEYHKRRW